MNKNPIVCLITGPAGAGKSSTSKLLATKFEKSAVIDVDYVRDMVVGGYVKPWPHNEETAIQIELGNKNTCDLTNNFLEKGFTVIINEVIGRKDFQYYEERIGKEKLKVFLLLPTLEALLSRFDKRGVDDSLRIRTHELHDRFTSRRDEFNWHVIDSSNQTLEETMEEIFKELQK